MYCKQSPQALFLLVLQTVLHARIAAALYNPIISCVIYKITLQTSPLSIRPFCTQLATDYFNNLSINR